MEAIVIPLGYEARWAFECVAHSFFTATLVVICQFTASLIIAKYLSSIVSQHEALRTIIHGASALLDSTGVQIFDSARNINAKNICSIFFQDVTVWSNPIITEGCRMTTCVPIGINALPPHAITFKCIRTKDEAFGAIESQAMVVFSTTLIQVCVRTYSIVAKNILSIDPVLIP
jgi:hypothetical protein